jgi:hypothetical protein
MMTGARNTERNGPGSPFSDSPYEMFRGTKTWEAVEEAIAELVMNDDPIERTRRDYIVGYICEKLHGIKENG